MRCLFYLLGYPYVTVLESIDFEEETNSLHLYEFGDSDPRFLVLDISRERAKFIMKTVLRDGYYDFSHYSVVCCMDDEE